VEMVVQDGRGNDQGPDSRKGGSPMTRRSFLVMIVFTFVLGLGCLVGGIAMMGYDSTVPEPPLTATIRLQIVDPTYVPGRWTVDSYLIQAYGGSSQFVVQLSPQDQRPLSMRYAVSGGTWITHAGSTCDRSSTARAAAVALAAGTATGISDGHPATLAACIPEGLAVATRGNYVSFAIPNVQVLVNGSPAPMSSEQRFGAWDLDRSQIITGDPDFTVRRDPTVRLYYPGWIDSAPCGPQGQLCGPLLTTYSWSEADPVAGIAENLRLASSGAQDATWAAMLIGVGSFLLGIGLTLIPQLPPRKPIEEAGDVKEAHP
jgi:hypothetical protein